ncbi:MAG: glycosyltransferase family 4 protein [Myxococcales bacterium]|nr:glycosyltransferase family 4 protein [Myxococcales bacterium]
MSAPGAREGLGAIALLGSHPPRRCGIATFTAHLGSALRELAPEVDCFAVAMDDVGKQYDYPDQVHCRVQEGKPASYRRAADFLNVNDVAVLSVQHEYGIFGGKAGAHVLNLLRGVRAPIVTTLHTILEEPSAAQRAVMDELCQLSERLVVMSKDGATLLHRVHGVAPTKIDLIPHGIPALPDAARSKRLLGVEGQPILLTFGLLSPDKGIEQVIEALPAIVARHPRALYIVLGATHPHVKEQQGEAYRVLLDSRAHLLGVEQNVIFHDRFVSETELVHFLSAADVYITPYRKAEQTTSGTLAYAVGCGKAVISTPYRYAQEQLAEGRGVLVPFQDSAAMASEVIDLISDDSRRHEIERRCSSFGQAMAWPTVAEAYMRTFRRAVAERVARPGDGTAPPARAQRTRRHPEVNLSHLRVMTDGTGLLQHAVFHVPRYEDGYCLDDNARGVVVLTMAEDAGVDESAALRELSVRYLAFVRHAFNAELGRFRNFFSYSRKWTESVGSEDSHGRALWALGTVMGHSNDDGQRRLATEIFDAAIPAVTAFTSPRAWAYALLGVCERGVLYDGAEPAAAVGHVLAERLLACFRSHSDQQWMWCEDRLTYCNARLPQALIAAGVSMNNDEMVSTGLRSLAWLASVQQDEDGLFAPIGSDGFYVRGGQRATFDQQPVEACGMVSACLQAYRATGELSWEVPGRTAFDWFLGRNQLDTWLYDSTTGGCRDGLHVDRRNENQGAESTLSFLMALMQMRQFELPAVQTAATAGHQPQQASSPVGP